MWFLDAYHRHYIIVQSLNQQELRFTVNCRTAAELQNCRTELQNRGIFAVRSVPEHICQYTYKLSQLQ